MIDGMEQGTRRGHTERALGWWRNLQRPGSYVANSLDTGVLSTRASSCMRELRGMCSPSSQPAIVEGETLIFLASWTWESFRRLRARAIASEIVTPRYSDFPSDLSTTLGRIERHPC